MAQVQESFEWANPIEFYKEDEIYPGAKLYRVKAIHVTMTGNKRKYTKEELILAGRTLTQRQLDLNHRDDAILQYPENSSLDSEYNPGEHCVEAVIRVSDANAQKMIEDGKIKYVSIMG